MKFTVLLAATTALSVAPAMAQQANQDLAPGGGGGNVLRAQLAIQGPATTVCPNQATMSGWVFTDFAGKVSIMIARKGQGVGAPFIINAVPAANGQHMATFTRAFPIITAIDTEYRLLVGGGDGVVSNWAPLKATCATGLGPQNIQGN